MPLNDPVTLLLIITPFGLMTMLLLCLSYVGHGKDNASLHWWIGGDLLLAAYRTAAMLQPGIPQGSAAWVPTMPPDLAFITGTTLLITAIGAHTVALYRLAERTGDFGWHVRVWLALPLVYALGATQAVHSSYTLPWFSACMVITVALQCRITLRLARSFRGALGLLAGQLVIVAYHGWTVAILTMHPLPPLPFDRPALPSIQALMLDFMVSFLFTLSYALALQEQLRMRIQQLSITDSLTGALNRRGAVSILHDEWARAADQRHPIAIAMVDLDHFKRINDQYGHSVGDVALQTFSGAVAALKRKSDVFVRWGGEEFLLLLPRTDLHQAQHLLGRLRETLKGMPLTPALPFHLEFSAGLADSQATAGINDFEAMLRAVDKALYRAKVDRNRVEVVQAGDI